MAAKRINIIGGGLSGLTAAYYLAQAGHRPVIIEADDRIGGRIQTDEVDGYRLDRGFQILLPAYPEAKAILDYDRLQLQYFSNGAEIYKEGKLIPFYDPQNGLSSLLKTVMNGPAGFEDLFKLLKFKLSLSSASIDELYDTNDSSTTDYLQQYGFSDTLIETFWKPFFQGIFLEDDLHTSSRLFRFIFKMFVEDGAAIPRLGMEEIPRQLSEALPAEDIICGKRVVSINDGAVMLDSGERLSADVTLIACELGSLRPRQMQEKVNWKQVTNLYFTTSGLPRQSKYVMLCANPHRVVNNVSFLSQISSSYAPQGSHLISVSANGDHSDNMQQVMNDLKSMFGELTSEWKHLKTYVIKQALPDIDLATEYNPRLSPWLYQCGDHHLEGSINAAMKSGRLAAEAIISA